VADAIVVSKSLAIRRLRLSRAKQRSTTQGRVRWNRWTSNGYVLAAPKKEKKTGFESFSANMSGGSIPESVAAALARLGGLLGAPDSMVLPGLAG